MIADFIFSANIVLPFVLVVILGAYLKRKRILTDAFFVGGNNLIFNIAIPSTLFYSVYTEDISELFDPAFAGFVIGWLILSAVVIWIVSYIFMRKKYSHLISAFVQACFRGNIIIVGLPLLVRILGSEASVGSFAIALMTPFYSVIAVIVLTVHNGDGRKLSASEVFWGVVKNPPFIGVMIGLIFSALHIPVPVIILRTISTLGGLTTPLALLCLGGGIKFTGFTSKFKVALLASIIKVVFLPIGAVSLAYLLGFSNTHLTVIMILNAVPSAFAAYVMAIKLGGDEYVAGNSIFFGLVLCAFTLTIFIMLFRTFNIIA